MQGKEKLTVKQIITRLISIVVGAIGIATCTFSFSLQMQDIGSLAASICWFTGLVGVVAGVSGYAVTCGHSHRYVPLAFVLALVLAIAIIYFEFSQRLYYPTVVSFCLAAIVFQGVVLIIYRQILKHEDPNAI